MNDHKAAIRHILVAHDFSDTADHALGFASDLARALGARVTIVHVCEVVSYGYAESIVAMADVMAQVQRLAASALQKLVDRSRAAGLEVSSELRTGAPRDEIVSFARECKADLIVAGTHGRKGVPRLLLGSVAESLVRLAPCPVLTVHGPESAK